MALTIFLALFQFQVDGSTGHRRKILVQQTLTRLRIVLPDPQAGNPIFLHFRQRNDSFGLYRVPCSYSQRIRVDRAVRCKSNATGNGSPGSQHIQVKAGIHICQCVRSNPSLFYFRPCTTACNQQKQQYKQPYFTYSFHCISIIYIRQLSPPTSPFPLHIIFVHVATVTVVPIPSLMSGSG